jgi:ATP-dependent HslUV protease ATP-binding subunit HslU
MTMLLPHDGEGWTCRAITAQLDRWVIGQAQAKRAVAIALRNRWRRLRLAPEARAEIVPTNILMIGPTGVGKTEIARRLATLAGLPFVKVEATKFTEKGYVGRDVDSMVRDLVESALALLRRRREQALGDEIDRAVEERLIDLLFPPLGAGDPERQQRWERSRDKIREQLRDGQFEDRDVTITTEEEKVALGNIFAAAGEEVESALGDALRGMMPRRHRERVVPVAQARRLLRQQEVAGRIDEDRLVTEAIDLAEQGGMIFLDEIDKIATRGDRGGGGPDVSREGVQRDLLPVVEGCVVNTRYGPVRTDHVLFIAAGAFHMSKPSDLIPELQGRFPVRVELESLGAADFVRILGETDGSLLKQYTALLAVDGVQLTFTPEAVAELANIAAELNRRLENIGARRLQTVMAQLLDDLLFTAPEGVIGMVTVDRALVETRLGDIMRDEDLSRYIL